MDNLETPHSRRCAATGKRSFFTKRAAEEQISTFRYYSQKKIDGRRQKHRQGKPAQQRVYHCSHCKGWHQTKMDEQTYKKMKFY